MDVPSPFDEELMARLPLAYAVALRMDSVGATVDEIAVALGVDSSSVGTLLEVGRRKFSELADGQA